MLPSDPFGRVRKPAAFDRAGRVRLCAELAEALLAGEPMPREAALFVGAALQAWLTDGGSLEHHLGVVGPRRSRLTPARLYERLRAEGADCCAPTATEPGDLGTVAAVDNNEDDR